jgi:dienelactone hydrolase
MYISPFPLSLLSSSCFTLSDTNKSCTDITGSASSTSALLSVYDVFGFAPQTLQGADILATTLGVRVVVPDFLDGRYAQGSWYAPTASVADKKEQGEFMGFVTTWDKFVPKVKEVVEGVEGVQKWGGYGLCWGGKVGFGFPARSSFMVGLKMEGD